MKNRSQADSSPIRNTSRAVLIIDDLQIRQNYFSQAHAVIQKMESVEEHIQHFHSTDQRLFDQWYKLTFREDQECLDRSREELRQIARFHNWVVATALKLQIEMPQAYALMKEEERLWQAASIQAREQIDLDREARDRYASAQIHGRYNESHQFESRNEDETEISAQLGQILSHLEVILFQEDFERELKFQTRMDRIYDLPDEELTYWLREQDAAFLLFEVSLTWSEQQAEYSFFKRIWSLMSALQKNAFAKVYAQLSGRSILELLEEIEVLETSDGFSSSTGSKNSDDDDDLDDFDLDLDLDLERKTSSARTQSSESALHTEKLKSIYRKLVRKLHPDLQTSNPSAEQISWTQKVWERVQKAYLGEDVDSLQRLFKLTLLRSNSLNQLTLDEILEARSWLEKDLGKLQDEVQNLKTSPAWGFSKRKDLSNLSRQLNRDFSQLLNQVRFQIAEVRRELDLLEILSDNERSSPRFSRR